jgi:predicted nucleotidyltransferase
MTEAEEEQYLFSQMQDYLNEMEEKHVDMVLDLAWREKKKRIRIREEAERV